MDSAKAYNETQDGHANPSLHATQSVGIDKNFITVYCQQEVADNPLPHPSDVRSITCLSSGRLHDSSLTSSEQTVLGGRRAYSEISEQTTASIFAWSSHCLRNTNALCMTTRDATPANSPRGHKRRRTIDLIGKSWN